MPVVIACGNIPEWGYRDPNGPVIECRWFLKDPEIVSTAEEHQCSLMRANDILNQQHWEQEEYE